MSTDHESQKSSGHSDTDASQRAYENYELPIEGFKGTPEEVERQWYEKCYVGRGDTVKQLTWRAVIMGSLLGAVLSLTNIYIGLKAGWGFGVAITACILSYAIWTGFYKMRLARTQMTILENNCMQSTASAAGYSTGGTLISAFAAYVMLNGENLPYGLMLGWVFFLAVLGVTMAVPMKRQMINMEQLRFPSGIAAAETLRALHATGQKGMRAARALGIAGLLAMISAFLTDGLRLLSSRLEAFQISTLVGRFNTSTLGDLWVGRTVSFAWDPIFIAAGMFVGMRVAISMFLGSILCWMVFVPLVQLYVPDASSATGFRALVQWTLWGGTACMVTSGILSVFFQWKSAVRAFKGLGDMLFKRGGKRDELDAIETPGSWFLVGQVISLIALALLAKATFGMPFWQSFVAVLLSFALALVACRVTGETDTTPVGAMGKITQLTFGVLSPGNMNVNLMAANITAGAATSSADLLTDLKSGYLLGAHPRKQFIAQFSGIFIGTLVTVTAFRMLVPDASVLGTDQFPAPAAQTWKGVAEAMALGLSAMHPVKVWAIVIGGLVGIILPVLSLLFPKQQKWIPSAAGIGLAWVFQWFYGFLFFLGALIAYGWQKRNEKQCEEYLFPVASGIVAGGALMGVVLVFWESGAEMLRELFG